MTIKRHQAAADTRTTVKASPRPAVLGESKFNLPTYSSSVHTSVCLRFCDVAVVAAVVASLALVAALPSTKVSTLDLRYNDYTAKGKGALAGAGGGGRKVLSTDPEKDAGKWRSKGGNDVRKMKPMKVQRGKRRPSAGAF